MVDARGYSCPIPVVMVQRAVKAENPDSLTVLVDEQVCVENVTRFANASGYKVWPKEVEDVLYSHPAVLEAAVVGVPDDYRGETVKAVISLRPGTQTQASELIEYCKERLAAYKYPRIVEVLDELPKTATGKILRRALR